MLTRFAGLLIALVGARGAEVGPFVERTCGGCHQGPKAAAGLDLRALPERWGDAAGRSVWVRVHDAVERGAMPPGGVAPAGRTEFLAALGRELRETELAHGKAQGRSVLRRLNRYEFENALRDLLHASWLRLRDSLPEDGLVQRLNKSGSVLDISHVQMARYMESADSALRQVIASSGQPMARQSCLIQDEPEGESVVQAGD